MLDALKPRYAGAEEVSPTDPSIEAETLT